MHQKEKYISEIQEMTTFSGDINKSANTCLTIIEHTSDIKILIRNTSVKKKSVDYCI